MASDYEEGFEELKAPQELDPHAMSELVKLFVRKHCSSPGLRQEMEKDLQFLVEAAVIQGAKLAEFTENIIRHISENN
jgi:uncharacterized protein YuzB (UPF0349 family)